MFHLTENDVAAGFHSAAAAQGSWRESVRGRSGLGSD
jgi:hypothetical protein